jgi:hypothetical protein
MLLEVAQAMQQRVLEQQAQLKALFDADDGVGRPSSRARRPRRPKPPFKRR